MRLASILAALLAATPAFATDSRPQPTIAELEKQIAVLTAELNAVVAQRDEVTAALQNLQAQEAAQRELAAQAKGVERK